jgi:hypothetical protein
MSRTLPLRASDETIATGRPPAAAPHAPTPTRARGGRGVRARRALLWTAQGLLAALFLFAGGMKLVTPIAVLTAQTPLPGALIRLVGVIEVLGALGLVLPGALRVRTALTPWAAAGLAVLMVGATGATLASPQAASAPIPVVVGLAAAAVAYSRRSWALPPAAAYAGGPAHAV